MNEQVIAKAEEIIKSKAAEVNMGAGVVLSLIDSDGYPTTSCLSISKSDGIKTILFCTTMDSNKAIRAKNNSKASVCLFDDEYEGGSYYNITLVGDVEILTDATSKKDAWYDGLEEHCGSPDDPNYCVLRFTTKRYNLWVDIEGEEVTGSF